MFHQNHHFCIMGSLSVVYSATCFQLWDQICSLPFTSQFPVRPRRSRNWGRRSNTSGRLFLPWNFTHTQSKWSLCVSSVALMILVLVMQQPIDSRGKWISAAPCWDLRTCSESRPVGSPAKCTTSCPFKCITHMLYFL